jgi:hypothetical protein
MGDDEAEDVGRVLVLGRVRKVGVGERVDDEEQGPIHVAKYERPEGWDLPVLTGADYDIEIAAELLTLQVKSVCYIGHKENAGGLTE